MPRVLIADDHVLIREGLRRVLALDPGMVVVGEAADAGELVELVASTAADVVLMDVNMPGEGSIETLQRIAALRPGLPVLVISMLPEEHVAPRLLRLGAAGYVSKGAAAEELVAAIRKVIAGGRYVSAALAERIAFTGTAAAHEALSPRELQVLRLIAGGRPVKEIADALALSVSTVHTHRARILEKLGVRSDVELTRYAVRFHLVD